MPDFSNSQAENNKIMNLKQPIYGEDMTASISMTGLTILKDGKYSNRIGGSAEYVSHNPFGIVTSKSIPITPGEIKAPKKKHTKEQQTTQPGTTLPRKTKCYKINKKQITHRIKNFTNQMSGEKKLYFWTVTFPSQTNDNTCFILLNRWLTRLRKERMLRSYLWVAERQDGKRLKDDKQQATNTIHFHLAFHQRICVKKANKFMRACIFTSVKDGSIQYTRKAAKTYNGVDIAKDRKTRRVINFSKQSKAKSLANYLTKYISKNEGTFQHLAWHCSRDYSNLIINLRMTLSEITGWNIRQCFTAIALFEDQYFEFFPWAGPPIESFINHMAIINNHIVSTINNVTI